jgi:tRNA-2-methylthio-N6-dimethylallyladenosine synthase
MPNQVAAEVVGERYTRLHAHQEAISASVNSEAIGRTMKVLVAEVSGRRNGENDRMTGRSEDFRLVHFNSLVEQPLPGDLITVDITESSSHYLIGNGGKVEPRAKRAKTGAMLGLPVIRS